MKRILLFVCFLTTCLFAEGTPRSLTVLPTSDTSELGLAAPLQTALGQLAQESSLFSVATSEYALSGFTKQDIARAFQEVQTELLTFVYMERARISVFLFDSLHPGEFILAFEMLNPPDEKLTSEYIEGQFRKAWTDVLTQYGNSKFQPLPGAEMDEKAVKVAENEDGSYKATQAKKLYRELAALEDASYYAGASIGMARFAAVGSSASTVNFGGTLGIKVAEKASAELGVDIFSYFLTSLSGRYQLPFGEKYVSLSASLGVARVMGLVTQNRGFASTNIKNGEMVFGPGLSFDIPLLGANLRGDLRFYLGSATILLGTYGIVYSL